MDMYCKMDNSLSDAEKQVFAGHLERLELADNIWDLFGEY